MIRVGQFIRDNDPRNPNRILMIDEIDDTHVIARPEGWHAAKRKARIAIKYIHLDDKPRRSGWSVVPSPRVILQG